MKRKLVIALLTTTMALSPILYSLQNLRVALTLRKPRMRLGESSENPRQFIAEMKASS